MTNRTFVKSRLIGQMYPNETNDEGGESIDQKVTKKIRRVSGGS